MSSRSGGQSRLWPAPRCRVCGCVLLPWLRPDQVAEALQISVRHLRRIVKRGNIRHKYIGDKHTGHYRGVLRIHHGSLHRYIDEQPPQPDFWEWPGEEILSGGRDGPGR